MKSFTILRQYLLPQHFFSRIMGWFAECRCTHVKNWMITKFIKRYQVDLREAVLERIEDYPNFNSFFTRHLKPELRPIAQGTQIVSPVDGRVSQLGKIEQELLFQAKGYYFALPELLGGDSQLAKAFYNGYFATFYLSPKDYHRVHMPISGKLENIITIPGKLFSVSPETTHAIPNLFSRNERIVCVFASEIGPVAVILVGAMIVGSIHINAKIGQTIQQGEELGYFKLGSTVIILFPQNIVRWDERLQENTIVKMGQALD